MTDKVLDPLVPKTLITSLKEAFSIQASTPIEIIGAKAVTPSRLPGIDIASVMGIRSTKLEGSLALCFPVVTFLGIVNHMLGEKYTEVTPENADAAGELLNILYAQARVKLNEAGYDFTPALPTVVRGEQIEVSHGALGMIVRIECKCQFGSLYLEVGLRKAT